MDTVKPFCIPTVMNWHLATKLMCSHAMCAEVMTVDTSFNKSSSSIALTLTEIAGLDLRHKQPMFCTSPALSGQDARSNRTISNS